MLYIYTVLCVSNADCQHTARYKCNRRNSAYKNNLVNSQANKHIFKHIDISSKIHYLRSWYLYNQNEFSELNYSLLIKKVSKSIASIYLLALIILLLRYYLIKSFFDSDWRLTGWRCNVSLNNVDCTRVYHYTTCDEVFSIDFGLPDSSTWQTHKCQVRLTIRFIVCRCSLIQIIHTYFCFVSTYFIRLGLLGLSETRYLRDVPFNISRPI